MSLYEQLRSRDVSRKRRRRITYSIVAALAAIALSVTGYVAFVAVQAKSNVRRSNALAALAGVPKLTKDTNILVMGLDSRVDEQGKPLSVALYDALDAGDQSIGGYNSNVLMLIHIPANGQKATAISIPRDDYVQIEGIPGQSFEAKIKEAYGYGLAAEQTALLAAGKPHNDTTYQQARDAGRQAELATVSAFLGSVHIDHFVEVTMAGFYEVSQAVAPITVCVNQATFDTYSGAEFKAGMQQIDAKQAMAFVRQRRDTSDPRYDLSDLDRERRQQAFIASVIHQLKQAGTFTDIPKMESVLNAVSKNIVVDSGLNLIELIQQAGSITSGNISFTTLPITGFGTSPSGESINTVDMAAVQATVRELLAPAAPAPTPAPGTSPAPGAPAPAPTALASPSSGDSSYSDWTGALQGGSIPCVK
ncbi:LCP family protein [Arthrobacter alpinus]|uniref:LCP family protein n=1 Tax=Arthrobacter alpinus TaxID=656366 RepID=UPI0021BDCFB7|nr:LCP family protein [Arthrobacter alpinus]